MKNIITSVSPYLCGKIASGDCKILVKKSAPKGVPFKAYIYCTSSNVHDCILIDKSGLVLTYATNHKTAIVDSGYCGNSKVIGEFICDKVERFTVGSLRSDDIEKLACLSYNEMINYFYKPEELDGKTVKQGFAWHISDLKIYDKPKELSEFKTPPCEKSDCGGCKYRVVINTPETYEIDCFAVNGREITRPPQSYMFVEEVETR